MAATRGKPGQDYPRVGDPNAPKEDPPPPAQTAPYDPDEHGGIYDFNDWLYRNGQSFGNWIDPARPFNQQAEGFRQASEDAKALAALQWQRQMAGLQKALGYTSHAQSAINSAYSGNGGSSLPAGLGADQPSRGRGPGLQAYLGRGR